MCQCRRNSNNSVEQALVGGIQGFEFGVAADYPGPPRDRGGVGGGVAFLITPVM
jgi:hypothetical protein